MGGPGLQGPAIFVAQYVSDTPPFNSLPSIAQWAASLGYKGIQVIIDPRLIDIERAASDQAYCDEILHTLKTIGITLTELSSHLHGQLIAVHPAYDSAFDAFAPPHLHSNPKAREEWARSVLFQAAKASKNLGLTRHATFSGSLAWPYVYPWPQRSPALVDTAFAELAKRWLPILDAFEEAGVDLCFELHPGEDLHDGVSFERFLATVLNHRRACILYDPSHFVLQQMDYLAFLDLYHDRIKCVHMKDAEFRPSGKQGLYGGFSSWRDRAGRFRALGDGQVDLKGILSKLMQFGYQGWITLEVECPFKDQLLCAEEGAGILSRLLHPVAESHFDDFAGAVVERKTILEMLGLHP